MTDILYEHPLNERFRNYLKIEQLFTQINRCDSSSIIEQYHGFFSALFTLLDILDRNDIRGDLIKDLEKLEQNLVLWSRSPDIDGNALTDTLKEVIGLLCQLKGHSPTWWQLKEDKLLCSVKQRFAIAGGSSSFDLPQLQFWLHQENTIISDDIASWTAQFSHVENALNVILKFIRLRGSFENIESDSGFYQDSGDGLVLLRIKTPKHANYYPSISGNLFRYSIRFMHPCSETGRRYANSTTHFKLAKC